MRKTATSGLNPGVTSQTITHARGGGPGTPMPSPPASVMPVSVAPPSQMPAIKTAISRFGFDLYLKGAR